MGNKYENYNFSKCNVTTKRMYFFRLFFPNIKKKKKKSLDISCKSQTELIFITRNHQNHVQAPSSVFFLDLFIIKCRIRIKINSSFRTKLTVFLKIKRLI